mgnify:CR=1 FL=1
MTLFPPDGGEEAVRRLTLWPGWVCCGLLALVFAFDPQVPQTIQLVPLVVSVVLVVGFLVVAVLADGAVDEVLQPRPIDLV